jgi:hypothetical protein
LATTLVALMLGGAWTGCGDDAGNHQNQNGNLNDNQGAFDAGVDASPPDAQVDDPLCPPGQACEQVGAGEVACLEGGQVPAGTIRGCHEQDGPDCPLGSRCLYLDQSETESACFLYCGQCPSGQQCSDVTGTGSMACTDQGRVPAGVVTGCYETGECPANQSCYYHTDQQGNPTDSFCLERCSPCREGTCPAGEVCDLEAGVCVTAPCTPGSCPSGEVCYEGTCIPDIGDGPGPGPGPTCTLPDLECSGTASHCGELVQFLPDNNPAEADYDPSLGYVEYPENGETWQNQYRSYLRRDVMMAIQYAAAFTACKADSWSFGNGGPIGTIDMSEADGAIPGTSVGSPGHPQGTHTDGFDIDMAYYQVNTSDNRARSVCDHYEGGADAYHCTAAPHLLDPWRTALFIGVLAQHPALRVIGVDGQVGPMVESALATLCAEGWLSGVSCNQVPLAYEVTDQGYGWFRFHHHHFHVSFSEASYKSGLSSAHRCLIPGCHPEPLQAFLRTAGVSPAPPRLVPVRQSLLYR